MLLNVKEEVVVLPDYLVLDAILGLIMETVNYSRAKESIGARTALFLGIPRRLRKLIESKEHVHERIDSKLYRRTFSIVHLKFPHHNCRH